VELLYGLVRTESAFVPDIRSWAGAVGLTQLMPATALDMAGRIRRRGGPDYAGEGEIALGEPEVNIHLGAVYLRYLLDRTESPLSALLAYNGGIGRIRRWRAAEGQLPEDLFLETIEYAETREYGRKVLAAAAAYGYLYYGMTMEALIADILR
jgi:soluble lytic murein transglycosylase